MAALGTFSLGDLSSRVVPIGLATLTLGALIAPDQAAAQEQGRTPIPEEIAVRFYHGADNTSRPVSYDTEATGLRQLDRRKLSFTVAEKDTVCVYVINAHPVLYSYTIRSERDTTSPAVPDLSGLIGILKPIVDQGASRVAGRVSATAAGDPTDDASVYTMPTFLQTYSQSVNRLSRDMRDVRGAIIASDTPEEFSRANGGSAIAARGRGLIYAKSFMDREALSAKGRFGDEQLAATVAEWARVAADSAANEIDSLLASALATLSEQLTDQIVAVRKAYRGARPLQRRCVGIGAGTTTLRLRIARKDTLVAKARDVGDQFFTVQLATRHSHPWLELAPLAFVALTPDVPQFSLRDGTIVEREGGDATSFRAGPMLLGNVLTFGERDLASLGFGLGVGLGGEGDTFSDILVGPVLSFTEVFRVGFAIGWSEVEDRLRFPGAVGEPLPEDVEELSDLLESSQRVSGFLTFTVSGLGLSLVDRD